MIQDALFKRLFLLCLFAATNKCCELPEHLQKKMFITIRAADGEIKPFLITWVKNSSFLCNLAAFEKTDPRIDIDLMSDKDTDLKNILSGNNLQLILEEVATERPVQQWPNTLHELIQLKKTYDYLDIIKEKQETFKRFSTCRPGDKEYLWGGHMNRRNTHNAFYSPIFHLFSWKYGDIMRRHNTAQTEITLSPKENICLEDLCCTSALKLCNVVQVTCDDNEQNVVVFDFKKVPTLQGISIVSSSNTPSLELKNLSGNEDFCVNIEGNISSAQHQKLSKMLWPHLFPWYRPSALFISLKHRTAQIISISAAAISIVLMSPFALSFYLGNKANKSRSLKAKFLYASEILCLSVGALPGGLGLFVLHPMTNSFREKYVYKRYEYQNKLIINGTLETPFTNDRLHIIENKLAHMTNKLYNWMDNKIEKPN